MPSKPLNLPTGSTTTTSSSLPPRLPHISAISSGRHPSSNCGPSSSSLLGSAVLDMASSSSTTSGSGVGGSPSMTFGSSTGSGGTQSGTGTMGGRGNSGMMTGRYLGGAGSTDSNTMRREDSRLNIAIVKERWGNQRNFMEAHGLRVGDPDDHEIAERILEGYRELERWDFGGTTGR